MTRDALKIILEKHKKWRNGEAGGECADLSGVNLSGTSLNGVNLSGASLNGVNLSGADLSGASLSCADLRNANLRNVNLRNVNLRNADLSGADLRNADLSGADLSGAKGLLSTIDYMEAHFERTPEGYIAYKTFNGVYFPPAHWKIEPGSVINEIVCADRASECGCGINVAPLAWVKSHYGRDIWKVLIRWEWLCGVCVPYHTDGKIRCERVELLEVVER